MTPPVTAALIVKNEQAMLPRCLQSLGDIPAIVLDTGSTDDTVAVAQDHGATVHTGYRWADHFADARNHLLGLVPHGWVLSIDADETLLTDPDTVRASCRGGSPLNVTMEAERGTLTFKFPRLFPHDGTVRWQGRVHNTLNVAPGGDSQVSIRYGYSPAHNQDPDRALRMLARAVEESGSARDRYYLAREWFYRRKWQACVDEIDRYLTERTWPGERADALMMKGRCLWQMQRGEEARRAVLEAIYALPSLAEAHRLMADMCYEPAKSAWLRSASVADNAGALWTR